MRARLMATVFCLMLAAFSAACAAGAAGGGGGSANQLSATELAAAAQNAGEPLLETLQRIRPQWLVVRTGQPSPIVLIDGVQSGSMSTLQTITTGRVERIVYVRPETAASRFGPGYEGGAFEVTLKR
jgi:hypothetical protein